MKIYFNIQLLLASLFIFSSGCKETPIPYDIVYCDFTSSVDTANSIKAIRENTLKILAAEGTQREIKFFLVTRDNTSQLIFHHDGILRDDPTPSERVAFKEKLKSEELTLKKILDSASSNTIAKDFKEPNSCIIGCIERALRDFKIPAHESHSLRLFILSDMLECCTTGINPKINLEAPGDIQAQIQLVQKSIIPDSSVSFSNLKDVEVFVIVSSNIRHKFSARDLQSFWAVVLHNYGYDKMFWYNSGPPSFINNIREDDD